MNFEETMNEAKYLLNNTVGFVGDTDACLKSEAIAVEDGDGTQWFLIYFGLRTI